MLSSKFRLEGYDVLTAVDGQGGIDVLRAGAPDLVLMNMILPGLSGVDLLKSGAFAGVPVIAFSNRDELESAALENGAAGYFHKPFDLDALVRKVRQVLDFPERPA